MKIPPQSTVFALFYWCIVLVTFTLAINLTWVYSQYKLARDVPASADRAVMHVQGRLAQNSEDAQGLQTPDDVIPGLVHPPDDVIPGVMQTPHDVIPMAYVITPTYARPTQKAELLRLCYTLTNTKRIHWIVVEDSVTKTQLVTDLLHNICPGDVLTFTHLNVTTPKTSKHKGVAQRIAGLNWIRGHVTSGPLAGGIYFADDDNSFDVRVFDAVRYSGPVASIWSVGLVGGSLVEGPVCSNGKVIGFRGRYFVKRKFPVDMAAFGVNVNYFLSHPDVTFTDKVPKTYLEDSFLRSLGVDASNLTTPSFDPNCTLVLAWHTKTAVPKAVEAYFRNFSQLQDKHNKKNVADKKVLNTVNKTSANIKASKPSQTKVESMKISGSKISNSKIADMRVKNAKITDRKGESMKIGGSKVADAKVESLNIAGRNIADNKVGNVKLAGRKIADIKVESMKIAEREIADTKVENAKIPGRKIADAKVENAKIADRKTSRAKVENYSNILDRKIVAQM